jgi:hypothetical protein
MSSGPMAVLVGWHRAGKERCALSSSTPSFRRNGRWRTEKSIIPFVSRIKNGIHRHTTIDSTRLDSSIGHSLSSFHCFISCAARTLAFLFAGSTTAQQQYNALESERDREDGSGRMVDLRTTLWLCCPIDMMTERHYPVFVPMKERCSGPPSNNNNNKKRQKIAGLCVIF